MHRIALRRSLLSVSTLAVFVGLGVWLGSGGEEARASTPAPKALGTAVSAALKARAGSAPSSSGASRLLLDDSGNGNPLLDLEVGGQHPEDQLVQIYQLLFQGQLDKAIAANEHLLAEQPNFDLARLTWADLLTIRSGQLQALGDPATPSQDKRLTELRTEAHKRVQSLLDRPAADQVPEQIVALPASVPYVIALDASRNRIYLYKNTPSGPQRVMDFYASVGKDGISKSVEGDQRTPLGVYFTQYHMDRNTVSQLGSIYGSGAMPLNYPNTYDRMLQRTGSGIWLHGVPFTTFSRAPQATDGCVAMANDDLQALMSAVPRSTPVILSKALHWVKAGTPSERRAEFLATWDRWAASRIKATQGDLASAPEAIRKAAQALPEDSSSDSFYIASSQGGSGPMPDDLGTRDNFDRGRFVERPLQGPQHVSQISDLSVFSWEGAKAPTMVTTFTERDSSSRQTRTKRQYWEKTAQGQWQIRAEVNLG
ncbi:L,D-transpeptidase family protein [Amphibiibacter pelophylacis]|uniref:L,D-transpeptidase n=1 Tax=Amphibiibacter pelophylacis TaxID=1799477 RepID=A0ACC6P2I7_9BURK